MNDQDFQFSLWCFFCAAVVGMFAIGMILRRNFERRQEHQRFVPQPPPMWQVTTVEPVSPAPPLPPPEGLSTYRTSPKMATDQPGDPGWVFETLTDESSYKVLFRATHVDGRVLWSETGVWWYTPDGRRVDDEELRTLKLVESYNERSLAAKIAKMTKVGKVERL